MPGEPLSVYIHVPFCSLKCSYCDFIWYANLEQLVPEYVRAMQTEMRLWSPALAGRPVPTVFFGGGTPSLLPIEHLASIIGTLRESFALDPDTEISLEANPGTISLEFLRGLIELGVNRLSFGVQSFDDDELVALDRIHTSDEVRQGYAWAREAGFKRINLDLIYGLTGQTLERWQSNVEQALALAPEHLSLYALTVEEGTKLAYDIDHGRAPEPDADLQADMWDWSRERMAAAGYEHYEISNWARPGEECRHNVVYWRNGDWLGLGPGAHSHLDGVRFADVYSPTQYVRKVDEAATLDLPSGSREMIRAMPQITFVDELSPELQMADTAILALRLHDGLDLADFERRYGKPAEAQFGEQIAEFTSHGFLERTTGRLRLTDRGRYVANEVFLKLLPD